MPASKPISIRLEISQRKIINGITIVFFLNIFFLLGTGIFDRLSYQDTPKTLFEIISHLSLSIENVAATWYSSMLLLVVAILAGFCFLADTKRECTWKDRFLNGGWIILILIFILLSFDEMGSFHEMIGETALFKNMGNDPGAGWYAFYVLITLVGVFMITFSLIKFKRSAWAFFFAFLGILLLASNPFQEIYEIDSMYNSANPSTWKRPLIFLLLEEGSEIFASFCFLVSFSIYARYSTARNNPGVQNAGYSIQLAIKRNFILYPVIFIIVLGLVMLVIKLNAWNLKGDDIGIPHNWFPSAMLFITATASILLYRLHSKIRHYPLYWIPAAHCLLFSIFFGINLTKISNYSGIYSGFLLAGSVIVWILLFYKSGNIITRLAFMAWSIFLFLVTITSGFLAAVSGYFSACFLLVALVLYYQQLLEKRA